MLLNPSLLLALLSLAPFAQTLSVRSTSTGNLITQSAPSEITLVYPDTDVYPSFQVQLGVMLDVQNSGGMNLSLAMALLHLNGTISTQVFDANHSFNDSYYSFSHFNHDNRYLCTQARSAPKGKQLTEGGPAIAELVIFYHLNYAGTYIAVWNLTYGTYPHPNQATGDNGFCGPGAMTSQSFLMNRTFSVGGDMTTFQAQHGFTKGNGTFFNHSTTLPSAPTGLVWRSEASSGTVTSKTLLTSRVRSIILVLVVVWMACS